MTLFAWLVEPLRRDWPCYIILPLSTSFLPSLIYQSYSPLFPFSFFWPLNESCSTKVSIYVTTYKKKTFLFLFRKHVLITRYRNVHTFLYNVFDILDIVPGKKNWEANLTAPVQNLWYELGSLAALPLIFSPVLVPFTVFFFHSPFAFCLLSHLKVIYELFKTLNKCTLPNNEPVLFTTRNRQHSKEPILNCIFSYFVTSIYINEKLNNCT